ncbi:MAG: hypothetical protein A3G41_04145 [Elusimicrobia bacterium RIFCSPLOWO2_12_FULL_59_9]|nr:MAG: hypothetical protein A3G41_04145 [Elusimicrobia bacterium RIFCSPLOWO2_12_FULL_59_9]
MRFRGISSIGWVSIFALGFVGMQRHLMSQEMSLGKDLYIRHCAVCHGEAGQGNGPAATFLFPKPRDFTTGMYKIRTTASGQAPTDQDLLDTLSRGLPGSAMPSFSYLSDKERKALVNHLKTFAPSQFEGTQDQRGIAVGKAPLASPEVVSLGRKAYVKAGCAACHGESGKGDGPSANALRDDLDQPILAADLTRGVFRGGASVRDIYLRFTTGMNGTPMPSFEETLPEKERWALAHYVKSLSRSKRPEIPSQLSNALITAYKKEGLSDDMSPRDSIWNNIPVTSIPLMPLWQRRSASRLLDVRAIHDGKRITLLLEWEDSQADGLIIRSQDFSDAAAIMLSMTDSRGHFSMGSEKQPVNIWQWRADRQMDLARFRDAEEAYPSMAVDDYLFDRARYPKHKKTGLTSSAGTQEPIFLAGYAAGNPMSEIRRLSAVEDLNAEGFGTLTPQPPLDQNVQGHGIWTNGKWKILFVRDLSSSSDSDAALKPRSRAPVAFAVWDGSQGDRDGQKSVTYWQILELEK